LGQLPPPVDSRAVRYRALDEEVSDRQTAFEALLRASRTDNRERLYQALRDMARGVTLAGLASILRLGPDADALAIVTRLDGEPEEQGPFWGGMPRPEAETDQRIRVLPPLEGDVLRALQQAKDEVGSDLQLVCTESMAGGIGVVAIDTYLVKRWADLLPPEYQQDLLATLSSADAVALAHVPGSKLYADGVFEALRFVPRREVQELLGLSLPAARPAPGQPAEAA
ncbi:MAG: hypothetical protein QME94_09360, partial [Anaerolineae bacterium]|nr:hypothetical protein [Anaerolineae bacterium]